MKKEVVVCDMCHAQISGKHLSVDARSGLNETYQLDVCMDCVGNIVASITGYIFPEDLRHHWADTILNPWTWEQEENPATWKWSTE